MGMRDRLKESGNKQKAVQEANLFMVKRLKEMVDCEKITEEYDVQFINHMYELIMKGVTLKEKQEAYLEKCFHHKY